MRFRYSMGDKFVYSLKSLRNPVPYAERYDIRLTLHPDDPPVPKLGKVSRIMISQENIRKAIAIGNSRNLGITMCKACYQMMGEDLYHVIPEIKDKIFFIHFRNATGNKWGCRFSD